MEHLFNNSDVSELLNRIDKLRITTLPAWGKMNASQMLAHCNISLETAMGLHRVPRPLSGRLMGWIFKPGALGKKPFGKNSPTDRTYIFPANLDFEKEKTKLIGSIKRFHEGGPAAVTTHPHPFFGKLTPEQWGVFQWKHLDHHLRQFGV